MNRTSPYFADEVWSHVRRVAELAAHLQVADTADGVPELCQGVGARHQQSHVGSDVGKLRGDRGNSVSAVEKNIQETGAEEKVKSSLFQKWRGSRR